MPQRERIVCVVTRQDGSIHRIVCLTYECGCIWCIDGVCSMLPMLLLRIRRVDFAVLHETLGTKLLTSTGTLCNVLARFSGRLSSRMSGTRDRPMYSLSYFGIPTPFPLRLFISPLAGDLHMPNYCGSLLPIVVVKAPSWGGIEFQMREPSNDMVSVRGCESDGDTGASIVIPVEKT